MTDNQSTDTDIAVTDSLPANSWAMFLHLSVLAGFVVPIAGLLAPLLIWQLKKDQYPELDAHGKVVMNWIISLIIYTVISGMLVFVVVGLFLLSVLMIISILFPIIGGIKANEGKLWTYPLSIPFLK